MNNRGLETPLNNYCCTTHFSSALSSSTVTFEYFNRKPRALIHRNIFIYYLYYIVIPIMCRSSNRIRSRYCVQLCRVHGTSVQWHRPRKPRLPKPTDGVVWYYYCVCSLRLAAWPNCSFINRGSVVLLLNKIRGKK